MQSWHRSKTNKLVAATLISLLTSCGSGGGKASNGNKNPEPTPIDLPKPSDGPSESNPLLITDEKTVAHIESQFASESERHVAAVIAADTLAFAEAKTPEVLEKIAHQKIRNLLCYAHTVKSDSNQEKIKSERNRSGES